jgi:hypothetical protein
MAAFHDPSDHFIRPVCTQAQIEKLPWFGQRQDALDDQLTDLATIADRFGFYDAADFIRARLKK